MLLLAPCAFAGYYLGGNIGALQLPGDKLGAVSGAGLKAGYRLDPHLALEGRLAMALPAVEGYGTPYQLGLLARISLLTDDVRPYLLLGPSWVDLRDRQDGGALSSASIGATFGLGLSLHVRDTSLQFEYLRWLDAADNAIGSVNLALVREF